MVQVSHRPLAVRIFVVLCAAYVASQFFRISNAVIAPELMDDLGLSPEAMGGITSVFFLAFAAGQLPAGVLLDRFGPRRTMSGLLCLAVAGAVAFAMAKSGTGLTVGRALMGLGCASGLMGALVLIGRWFPADHFATLSSVLFTVGGLGNLLATTPLAATSEAVGWRGSFMIMAAATAVLALLLFIIVRDAPPTHEDDVRVPEGRGQFWEGLREVLTNRQLWYICAIQFVCYSSLLTVAGLWGGPYLNDVYGLDGVSRGNVLLGLNVAILAGVMAYGPVERIVGSRKGSIAGGAILTIAVLAALACFPQLTLWQATALLLLFGFVGGYFMLVHAHARAVLPDRLLGRGLTFQNTAVMGGVFVIQGVSGFVVGAFAQVGGAAPEEAYRAVFGVLSALTFLALVVYLRIQDVEVSVLRECKSE